MRRVLQPTTDLSNRITAIYPSLSPGHRRAADFVLQNPLDVATMTIEGLAEGSGSSNATVTRFVRALGYASYAEFRAALLSALKLAFDPVDTFAGARSSAGSPFTTFTEALSDQMANLQSAREALDEASITKALDMLLSARRIYIVASGASHHVASLLEDGLTLFLEADVNFVSARGGGERAIRHMLSVKPEDLVIAIAMPRYSRMTVDIATLAQQRKARLLVLTDSPTSPLATLGDVTLLAPARNRLLPNSPVALLALADALVTAVARQRPDAVEALKGLSRSLLWTFHQ